MWQMVLRYRSAQRVGGTYVSCSKGKTLPLGACIEVLLEAAAWDSWNIMVILAGLACSQQPVLAPKDLCVKVPPPHPPLPERRQHGSDGLAPGRAQRKRS